MKNKLNFYEIVKIKSTEFTFKNGISDLEGVVMGMAKDKKGNWRYSIHIYKKEEVWDLKENILEKTGKMDTRKNFYDNSSLKVKVDPNTGEGKIDD